MAGVWAVLAALAAVVAVVAVAALAALVALRRTLPPFTAFDRGWFGK
ncbi:hypothetical protein [Paenibacillus sp. FSL P4-0502]